MNKLYSSYFCRFWIYRIVFCSRIIILTQHIYSLYFCVYTFILFWARCLLFIMKLVIFLHSLWFFFSTLECRYIYIYISLHLDVVVSIYHFNNNVNRYCDFPIWLVLTKLDISKKQYRDFTSQFSRYFYTRTYRCIAYPIHIAKTASCFVFLIYQFVLRSLEAMQK